MTTRELAPPPTGTTTPPPRRQLRPAPEPIGERWVRREGTDQYDQVFLYETDLLSPEEGDQFMQPPFHVLLLGYLHAALLALTRGRPDVAVSADRLVDFQAGGVRPLGPDLCVVVGATVPDDPTRATYRVRASGGRPLLVVEVLSDGTRRTDTGAKFDLYHRAGVDYYLLIDRRDDGSHQVEGHFWTEAGYEPMTTDPDGTYHVPEIGAGFRAVGDRVLVIGPDGAAVPNHAELIAQLQADRTRLAALEAELRRLRGEN